MWQDLRFGVRTLARNPGFTAVAIAALALGIGANATVFSLVNAVLFKNLPFADSEKVLYVTSANAKRPRGPDGISLPDYQDLRSQVRSFEALGANYRTRANLSDDSTLPETYGGAHVTASTLAAIGQHPLLGRGFEAADEKPGAPPVVILSYALWEKRYGKDPSIVGRTIRLNSVPATVVGVLPKGVLFPAEADFWQPLIPLGVEKREDRNLSMYGKLAPVFTPGKRAGGNGDAGAAPGATIPGHQPRHTLQGAEVPGCRRPPEGAYGFSGAAGSGRLRADDCVRQCG